MPPGPAPALPCTHRLTVFRTAKVCPPLSSLGFDFLCSVSFQSSQRSSARHTTFHPPTHLGERLQHGGVTGERRSPIYSLYRRDPPFPAGPPVPPAGPLPLSPRRRRPRCAPRAGDHGGILNPPGPSGSPETSLVATGDEEAPPPGRPAAAALPDRAVPGRAQLPRDSALPPGAPLGGVPARRALR